MIGYKLTRGDDGTWMFCGTTAEGVANVVKSEVDADRGLSLSELQTFHVEPFEITQEEIDNMPDFPGW